MTDANELTYVEHRADTYANIKRLRAKISVLYGLVITNLATLYNVE